MSEKPGPHLLGRVPSPPDDRDYQLADFLAIDPDSPAAGAAAAAQDE